MLLHSVLTQKERHMQLPNYETTIKAKPGEMGTDESGFLFSIGLFILMLFLI